MMNSLEHEVLDAALLSEGDHVLVAVSGGADSMALLGTLVSLRDELSLRVSAAHFDHQLRDNSAHDGDVVSEYCAQHTVEYYAGAGDVSARAHARGESIEATARDLRYAFLDKTATRVGADKIATAHTQSDQVETILMRLTRGAGTRGVAGIPAGRNRIIRPLLRAPGDATKRYCRDNGIPFVVDTTNDDITIERNHVRHEILPGLRALCPDIDDRLLRLGATARTSVDAIRKRTDAILRRVCAESDGVWSIALADLATLDEEDRVIFFGDMVTERLGSTRELGRVHYDALIELSRDDTATGKRVSLPGYEARREHDAIVFSVNNSPSPEHDHPVELAVPGTTRVGNHDVCVDIVANSSREHGEFRVAHHPSHESAGVDSGHVAYFARAAVGLPLVVRTPRPGDRIRPFGMRRGHKKLSDIFVDNAVPHRLRATTLLVTDPERILWAVGVVTSDAVRVEPDCEEVLRVRVMLSADHITNSH